MQFLIRSKFLTFVPNASVIRTLNFVNEYFSSLRKGKFRWIKLFQILFNPKNVCVVVPIDKFHNCPVFLPKSFTPVRHVCLGLHLSLTYNLFCKNTSVFTQLFTLSYSRNYSRNYSSAIPGCLFLVSFHNISCIPLDGIHIQFCCSFHL